MVKTAMKVQGSDIFIIMNMIPSLWLKPARKEKTRAQDAQGWIE